MPSPILVVGSANVDLVVTADRFPEPGETVLDGTFEVHPGGKGANQAVAAARAGAGVSFIAAVGADSHGQIVLQAVTDSGVDTAGVEALVDVPTGVGVIFIDANGENRIVVASGANLKLSHDVVSKAVEGMAGNGYVLAQLEVPLDCVLAASQHSRFILNPAPAQKVPAELFSRCFAVTPNQWEAKALTDVWPESQESCDLAAKWFLDRGAENVVITLGSLGASWHHAKGSVRFPAPAVEVRDTTAAGDAFSGTLVGCLATEIELVKAVKIAVAAASLSVTRSGAIPSLPTKGEIERLKSEA